MGEFSLFHWLVVAVIVLLFFGPSRLPEIGKGLGEAIRGFKKGLSQDDEPKHTAHTGQLNSSERQASHATSNEKSRQES